MLQIVMVAFVLLLSLVFAKRCCAESGENGKREGYATRTIESGTKVKLIVGETVIPAILNHSRSARALVAKLPYAVRMQRYAHDYCGVMKDPLPYDKDDMRSGWLNGDIAFAVDGNYFTILYKDEDISRQFDGIVNMGVINAPLSVMDTLDGSITLKIELE